MCYHIILLHYIKRIKYRVFEVKSTLKIIILKMSKLYTAHSNDSKAVWSSWIGPSLLLGVTRPGDQLTPKLDQRHSMLDVSNYLLVNIYDLTDSHLSIIWKPNNHHRIFEIMWPKKLKFYVNRLYFLSKRGFWNT